MSTASIKVTKSVFVFQHMTALVMSLVCDLHFPP